MRASPFQIYPSKCTISTRSKFDRSNRGDRTAIAMRFIMDQPDGGTVRELLAHLTTVEDPENPPTRALATKALTRLVQNGYLRIDDTARPRRLPGAPQACPIYRTTPAGLRWWDSLPPPPCLDP